MAHNGVNSQQSNLLRGFSARAIINHGMDNGPKVPCRKSRKVHFLALALTKTHALLILQSGTCFYGRV